MQPGRRSRSPTSSSASAAWQEAHGEDAVQLVDSATVRG